MTVATDPPRSVRRDTVARTRPSAAAERSPVTAVSLFSGIAGLDRGLEDRGVRVAEMCESWQPARRVLAHHYPTTHIAEDVTQYTPAVPYSVLSAGFPCTDLSHAGSKAGIFGPQSGLVEHVFRIAAQTAPEWIVLENVPNLLTLHRGAGISEVVRRLEQLGYQWAYRTVDSRFTGIPQRRYRVIVLASLSEDPAPRLLGEDAFATDAAREPAPPSSQLFVPRARTQAHGFYWTEGRNGLGLVDGAIPTLKGGSTLGTPSAPAVWFPHAPRGRRIVLPRVGDGEELQGLPRGWTTAALAPGERDLRWKLLGNAVTRGVGTWIGDRITAVEADLDGSWQQTTQPIEPGTRWPKAATGGPGRPPRAVSVSDYPRRVAMRSLADIVDVMQATPLSHRATRGFLSRVAERPRRFDADLYADLEDHLAATRPRVPSSSQGSQRGRTSVGARQAPTGEMQMRTALTEIGLRYQLERRPIAELHHRLPIVFPGARVAVGLRSCFWDGCSEHRANQRVDAERWAAKLERRRVANIQAVSDLSKRNWIVIDVWEHDDPIRKAREIEALVTHRRRGSVRPPGEPAP